MGNSCDLYCQYNCRRLFLVLSAGSIKPKATEYDFTAGWNLRKRNCRTKGCSSGSQDQECLSYWNCWRAEKVVLYIFLVSQLLCCVKLVIGLSYILYMYGLWIGYVGFIECYLCLAFPVSGCRPLDQGPILLGILLLIGLVNILCLLYAVYWLIFGNRLHCPLVTL